MVISPANFGEEINTFEQRTNSLKVASDKPMQLNNRTSLIQEFDGNDVDNYLQREKLSTNS